MIPPMTSAGKENSKDIEVLIKKMEAFTEVAEQLQRSYDELQVRIKKLDLELADKNKELEKNLVEKEEVKNYLNDILESLTNGVIVVDRLGRFTTFNQSDIPHQFMPKTKIQKMQYRVFNPANIMIHRQPVVCSFVQHRLSPGCTVTGVVPAGFDESIEGIRLALSHSTAFGALGTVPLRQTL